MSKKYLIDENTLIDIANAIREKQNNGIKYYPDCFADEIRNIPVGKTTKTINIDWSSDFEQTAVLNYYDENFAFQEAYCGNVDVIEAQGGIVLVYNDNIDYMTDNFIQLPSHMGDNIYMATKDNETIGLYSSSVQ